MGERTAAIERAAVVIDGRLHTRVHRAEGRYYTLAGDVVVERSLYRAERNGPVIDAIGLRIGAVEGVWLPETATAMGHLLQQGTSAARPLITVRMKRSGARWKDTTARDVINLRALALSDRWKLALPLTLAPLRRAVRAAA